GACKPGGGGQSEWSSAPQRGQRSSRTSSSSTKRPHSRQVRSSQQALSPITNILCGRSTLIHMDEERIALFLDYENLAIGARDSLGGMRFDFGPIADALAERGRVVVRRAYADWTMFDDDRRMLTRHHVELIEIPQRMGATRKNAADIKMAV